MIHTWVKARVGLEEHPKTFAMAQLLASDLPFARWWSDGEHDVVHVKTLALARFVASTLLRVWANANTNIHEGFIKFGTLEMIDAWAGCPSFGKAMAEVGWVAQRNRSLEFPNFSEWNKPQEERRAPLSSAERTRRCRARKKAAAQAGGDASDASARKIAYSELLRDPRWQRKRLEVFNRDNFTCQECGNTSDPLHIHHKRYQKGKLPWEYADDDLSTLCEGCHDAKHSNKPASAARE